MLELKTLELLKLSYSIIILKFEKGGTQTLLKI